MKDLTERQIRQIANDADKKNKRVSHSVRGITITHTLLRDDGTGRFVEVESEGKDSKSSNPK